MVKLSRVGLISFSVVRRNVNDQHAAHTATPINALRLRLTALGEVRTGDGINHPADR